MGCFVETFVIISEDLMGPMIKGLIGKRKQTGGATQNLSQTMHRWGIFLLRASMQAGT